jgi:hypothetical protein
MPEELWLEVRAKSHNERDISLALQYSYEGASASDNVNATAVMINLGNAVYRELDLLGIGSIEVGHSAIVYSYTGDCTPTELNNASNYWIIEMDGPTDNKSLSTMTEAPGLDPMGCYTAHDMTYRKRLKVIETAKELVSRAGSIDYCFGDVLLPDNWNDSITSVDAMRCDGLVEVCYEINLLDVWGKLNGYPANYDIRVNSFQLEHNDMNYTLWKRHLAPATQCGNVEDGYEGVYWDSDFTPQNLCEPVGNTGGWD